MLIKMAPFETFREHGERASSEEPYSNEFINKCREKALEYDKERPMLRRALLLSLQECIPRHFKEEVFGGIGDYGWGLREG